MENLQGPLYGLTLLIALLTAILGILVAERMANKKTTVKGGVRLVFGLLAIGYTCFALAELTWYLIFEVFKQTPSASMPDFYWVVGSVFLLGGFLVYAVQLFRTHGEHHKIGILAVIAAVLLGIVIFFIGSLATVKGKGAGGMFLGYFYPVMSSLILVFSISVYLFFEKISEYKEILMFFMLANIGFLLGDLFYTLYSSQGAYGLVGVLSDVLYVLAYLLSGLAFFFLLKELRAGQTGEGI